MVGRTGHLNRCGALPFRGPITELGQVSVSDCSSVQHGPIQVRSLQSVGSTCGKAPMRLRVNAPSVCTGRGSLLLPQSSVKDPVGRKCNQHLLSSSRDSSSVLGDFCALPSPPPTTLPSPLNGRALEQQSPEPLGPGEP